jgi:hypothetical protein
VPSVFDVAAGRIRRWACSGKCREQYMLLHQMLLVAM